MKLSWVGSLGLSLLLEDKQKFKLGGIWCVAFICIYLALFILISYLKSPFTCAFRCIPLGFWLLLCFDWHFRYLEHSGALLDPGACMEDLEQKRDLIWASFTPPTASQDPPCGPQKVSTCSPSDPTSPGHSKLPPAAPQSTSCGPQAKYGNASCPEPPPGL